MAEAKVSLPCPKCFSRSAVESLGEVETMVNNKTYKIVGVPHMQCPCGEKFYTTPQLQKFIEMKKDIESRLRISGK